jgi:hypothetical protein
MHGIFFYLETFFMLFILFATGAALYMGIFKAHKSSVSLGAKLASGFLSAIIAGATWFGLYSWSYLSW